jgi:hypothetical protein
VVWEPEHVLSDEHAFKLDVAEVSSVEATFRELGRGVVDYVGV